jgi:Spy/CpxP family protein refolding chaperone
MKRSHKLAAGLIASLGLGLAAAAVYAHPGAMEGGMGHGAMGHGGTGPQAGQQLMTPEERTAMHEKMRNATSEERKKFAAEMRSEMQKRAKERGITLNKYRGPSAGADAPDATEHKH